MNRLTLALLILTGCTSPPCFGPIPVTREECSAYWARLLDEGLPTRTTARPVPVPGGWLRSTPTGDQVYVPTCCPSKATGYYGKGKR